MPGGAGSNAPINFTDVRLPSSCGDECVATNNADGEGDPMTVVTGDGVRRRKVIRAAKETLDKGKKNKIKKKTYFLRHHITMTSSFVKCIDLAAVRARVYRSSSSKILNFIYYFFFPVT